MQKGYLAAEINIRARGSLYKGHRPGSLIACHVTAAGRSGFIFSINVAVDYQAQEYRHPSSFAFP
ncbi:hypothetical protein, partial [Pantoea ananatis]|uniref:hypothetical protein n=1 Tax=Pantoea ananas TaxID=553 RepID=UPI001B30277B